MPLTRSPRSDLCTFYLKRTGFSRNSAAASWLSGSLGLGSRKRKIRPSMTLPTSRTGFQSARRMFRQTAPSVSMLGWYTGVLQWAMGGLCGYSYGGVTVKLYFPPNHIDSRSFFKSMSNVTTIGSSGSVLTETYGGASSSERSFYSRIVAGKRLGAPVVAASVLASSALSVYFFRRII